MQTQSYDNAGEELDAKVHAYADKRGCSYAEAMHHVAREEPELARRYAFGESETDREIRKGAEEFDEYVRNYQSEFGLSRREAERQVGQHVPKVRAYAQDPATRIYSQGGEIVMNTEKIPLSAESVVDVRAQEHMNQGKTYAEAMREVLADDSHLAMCYSRNLPYVQASAAHAYQEDPMASQIVQAITEPRPGVTVTVPGMPPGDFTSTAIMRLGILINGARKADNSIDIPLALQIGNLTPDLVRGAASERLDALTRAQIDGERGIKSERYPDAFRKVQREHPELVSAAESGRMTEDALREIYWPWFSRD